MKTFLKTILRLLKSQIGRVVSISMIIMLGVALSTGIGASGPKMQQSGDAYYTQENLPDINVKSTSLSGFTSEQLDFFANHSSVQTMESFVSYDRECNDHMTRFYYYDFKNKELSKLQLLEGRMPENAFEVLSIRGANNFHNYMIGDTFNDNGQTYHVVGKAADPLLFYKKDIPSNEENKNLEAILCFDNKYSQLPIVSDIFLKLNRSDSNNIFTNKYQEYIEQKIEVFESELSSDDLVYLTHEEMISLKAYKENIKKMISISYIFPIFFIVVISLVVLTTMTRLVEDERKTIGCYLSLGYKKSSIRFKYLLFGSLCCLLGGLLGIIVGELTLTNSIYVSFAGLFYMPKMSPIINVNFGLISFGVIALVALIITNSVLNKFFKEKPCQLFNVKAPKTGGKVFLERIPFIWNRLKFKYKSSFRNIFRYLKRFFMTVLSTAGSTALVFAGLGLRDATIKDATIRAGGMVELIAWIIIACAAILSILVTFNLTNMNIEERKREIATLKVLGYNNFEVVGYIYREVFILCFIGIACGLPLGYFFVDFVFTYLEFGALADVSLLSWFMTAIISFIFVFIVDAMLYNKIIKIDAISSLKSIE